MQSQLTRRVFRAILNNEPLSSSKCQNRCIHTVRLSRSRKVASGPSYVQRRGLFAFNFNPPTAPPSSTLPSEVGLKPMRDLLVSLRSKSRQPEVDTLAKAFQDFFETRAGEPGVITQFQAQLISTTWYHLQSLEESLDSEEWQRVFSNESLENVLYVLSKAECLPQAHGVIRLFARSVFQALCDNPDIGRDGLHQGAIISYIDIQAIYGDPAEARQTVEKFWGSLRKVSPSPWLAVIRGFALLSDDKQQIKRVVKRIGEYGVSFDSASQKDLIQFLIEQDLLDAVKVVYECPLSDPEGPSISTKLAAIKYAIMKTDTAWAQPIYESLPSDSASESIGIRLLWNAAQGKDASQIARNVESLASKEPELWQSLTISCVNDLMQYANATNNPTLAYECMTLAPAWGLVPDSQTQLLHLESRIQAGDLAEVLNSIGDLEGLNTTAPEALPLMNKLITMLCTSGQDDTVFNHISSLLDPLLDNNVRFEADTLTALTHMLLYRHDLEAASELLRPRLGSYDTEERHKIRTALTNFIQDPSQESEPAWEAYMLLQLAFPETGVSMRSTIMTSFFQRNRSDLAFLVFGHMRQAEDFAQRPKPDTYARCFRGLAQTQDSKHLELVHNMLKLDTEVDLNTRLLNWLMLAYAECDMPEKSMQIFREILQSEEGPSQRTIFFFFRACEKHHNGTHEAMKMVEKMKRLEIAFDRRLYTAYVEALAAQCEFDLATEALDAMKDVTGHSPTFTSIGHLYNAIPYQHWKDEVEKWAKDRHPNLWAQLEKIEREEHEEGLKFKLPRKRDLSNLDGSMR
ncbi:hypothetical protein AN7450.2 [Aspergillus nidulans FGSC A4]|uniref:Mitochondrial respiratory complex I chaperone (Cia84), putative (AFU_orthologue AFUA_2G06020) n=1 Tax=Emericella nidulans (strain FGSC A4 / ATCC 38163 / CBS 112.46 / NRRL 194 / M139) TaxID=227321 RepID=Q5AW80_EMENI|nr:hypothetical protein [Aspergillus nidulans FGSC A4]EAA62030.1 hypothetical protein AN7450.2 [Aspergillus nidulans FGSC A4]CBF79406.1 TPA: mitochondrial respiratory complex I chaperone (Cia84), putative (AFU_orthologue; AFUA_2G06020) [Aspergillus nidulans FGSC A4]|eukprot:XP_680719.1 hypothetical protein AN7450.2 [Aspergillus nidulans FGSC A4]